MTDESGETLLVWREEEGTLRRTLKLAADQIEEHLSPGPYGSNHVGCSACGRTVDLIRKVLGEGS